MHLFGFLPWNMEHESYIIRQILKRKDDVNVRAASKYQPGRPVFLSLSVWDVFFLYFFSFFLTPEDDRWTHPSLGCHINDTIASDGQIAFDSELPRHRCIGPNPSRRRPRCQTTERSFEKHWQHPVFSFSSHFLTSSQKLPISQMFLLHQVRSTQEIQMCLRECCRRV